MRRVGTLTGLMQRFASPRVLRVASAAPRFAAASPLLCAAPRVAARSARGFAASGGAQPSLSSLLSRELEHELAEYETPELVKEGPPEPFELSEEPGSAVVLLTRSFGGEEVTITLNVQEEEEDEEEEEDWENDEDEEKAAEHDEDGEEDEEEAGVNVFFDVAVAKGPETLEFRCVTDGFSVDILSVGLEGDGQADALGEAYAGPTFSQLDEEVQAAFDAYLEERGVDAALAEFIVELSVDKEQREYTNWLKRMTAFTK